MITRRLVLAAGARSGLAAATLAWPALGLATDGASREDAAAHALNRLGYGPAPGQLAAVTRDPRAWVDAQLQPATLALPPSLLARLREQELMDQEPSAMVRQFLALTRQQRANARGAAGEQAAPLQPVGQFVRQWQLPAYESRIFRALESPRQLEEVMVAFWFNHFNVFQGKSYNRVLVGHYEQYAIRPYAMGRFADLLHATARHPAMLHYLDNAVSAGGGVGRRGLNENYARELMELHTLGVDGGYTQADVTELARMLTGWTIAPLRDGEAPPAPVAPGDPRRMPGFRFAERMHDAGDKQWLGHTVRAAGQEEGVFALDTLARHPATARHIAFQLAGHFVSDAPPPALVERLARVFQAQDGQLVPVLRTLFTSPEFWSPALAGAKFKTPTQYAFSALRAVGRSPANVQPLLAQLAGDGMPLFGCQTPDGYKDTEAAWLSPNTMGRRVEWATRIARGQLAAGTTPQGLDTLLAGLGPLVTPATRALAEENREDPALAVALALAGPGMMRR